MNAYHLAQINIALPLAPLTDPRLHSFVSRLAEINALAEGAPGFVWRLKDEEGVGATAIRIFDDDLIIVNMSVWENIDTLFQYTYYSDHVQVYRQRNDWMVKMDAAYFAMWWIPAGHIPTPQEGREKIEHIRAHGATPLAFTFKQRFTPEEMLAYAD